jgi:hypothetical protein
MGDPTRRNILKAGAAAAAMAAMPRVFAQQAGKGGTGEFYEKRGCQTPILVLPDDSPAHPYAVAMESAMLAPKAEVSMFPWKEPKERIPLAVRQIHSFLKAHRPA